MRRGLVAALVCAAVLAMPGAANAAEGDATLERYARDTWASFVAMTDAAQRPAGRRARGRRRALRADLDDQHRRVPVERGRGRAARDHRPRRARRRGRPDAQHARGDGAPRAQRPVLQLVRPPRRRQAHALAADRRRRWTRSSPPSTTAGWRPGCGSSSAACRQLAARAGALYDSMDFGFYYVPERNRILFHYSPAQGTGPCCYDTVVSESRIADYIGTAKGELPRKTYYGRWRTFPDSCDYSLQETRPSGFNRSYDGVTVYEGSYPYGSTRAHAELGRLDVRGADARLFVPEERWGAGLVADEPPVHRRRADRPRAQRRAVRHVGLLAVQHARGRLRAATASTPPAWTRTGCPSNEDGTLVDRGFAGCTAGPRSPTRPRARTRTASSRRTPRSSGCATGARRRSRTSRGSSGSPAPTAGGASRTRSTSAAASRRPPGSRSTRA